MDKVYYHANCADGVMAAAIALQSDKGLVAYPAKYSELELLKGEVNNLIFFVDFAPTMPYLKDLLSNGNSVVIIDHHDTMEKNILRPLVNGSTGLTNDELSRLAVIYDKINSGAYMTWVTLKYMTPDSKLGYNFSECCNAFAFNFDADKYIDELDKCELYGEPPASIACLSIADTFQQPNDKHIRYFHTGISKSPLVRENRPEDVWDLNDRDIDGENLIRLYQEGKVQVEEIDARCREAMAKAWFGEVEYEGILHKYAVVPATNDLATPLGFMLYSELNLHFAVIYELFEDKTMKVSFRGNKTECKIPLNDLATSISNGEGGGHPTAAGARFKTPSPVVLEACRNAHPEIWADWIKDLTK